MKYLLDTDVIVDHLRGKRQLEESILVRGASVSIITQAEIFFGAYKFGRGEKDARKIKRDLKSLRLKVLGLEEVTVKNYAKVKAFLEEKGGKLEDFDLLIAATALNFGLTLVTRNVKHFERIKGLKVLKA